MRTPTPFSLRAMTQQDVEAGLRLCRLSHWNQVARDWDQFLRLAPGGATVAVDSTGAVVGSVATMRYAVRSQPGEVLAWIAMVLVDPVCRGAGIGTALLEAGLASVSDVATVGLDATPLGQPLYEKLGFTSDRALTRMLRTPAPGPRRLPSAARPARAADIDRIAALDADATGLDRRAMLEWLHKGAPELAWVSDGPQGIEGFMLGRHGHTASQLGPVQAASTDVALALVAACLAAHPAQAFLLDVADAQPDWRQRNEAVGFVAQRPFTRMYRGAAPPPGDATQVFATIGPEFG